MIKAVLFDLDGTLWEVIDSEFNKKVVEPLKNKYPKYEKIITICRQIIDVIVIIIVMYYIGNFFNNYLIM